MSVSGDILRSFRSPRIVVREQLDRGRREDRALALLMLACGLIFVAQWPRLARAAHLSEEVPLSALLAGALFGWLFIAPLAFYGLAALLHLLLRLAGFGGTMYGTRLVVFWSLLAVSPLVLAQGLVAGLTGPGMIAASSGVAVLGAFGLLVAAGLREAALEAPAATA